MITEKDFNYVGLQYVNPHLTYDPNYISTNLTFNNGGCSLHRLKNKWQRFLAGVRDSVSMEEITSKIYRNKVIKLTCQKTKLLQLSEESLSNLKQMILDWLNERKYNIEDVIIYAIEDKEVNR